MLVALTVTFALVPSILLMWFFQARDVFPEPPRVLWATFGLGVLTIPAVLMVVFPAERVLGIDHLTDPLWGGFAEAFVHASIPEEFFKFLVVYFYAQRHDEFDEPADGVVYGVAASLGFATLENILYVAQSGLGTAIVRAFTAVPQHACSGAIMGYFVGQAKFRPRERPKLLAGALFFPTLLHGLYDAPLMAASRFHGATPSLAIQVGLGLLFLAALGTEVVWAVRLSGRLRDEQLALLEARRTNLHAVHPPASPVAAPFSVPPLGLDAGPVSHRRVERLDPDESQSHWPAASIVPADGPRRWRGWLGVLLGVPITMVGGTVILAVVVALFTEETRRDDVVETVIGTVLIGVVPLVLGLMIFVWGVRILNRDG
ncbi:MAG: PrsW family glutamic-type intramembrane protease [Myxococcota bacterium]